MTHTPALTGSHGSRWRLPRRALLLAGCLATLASGTATAEHVFTMVDECMETSTAFVRLPSSTGGTLGLRNCETCEAVYVSFQPDTRFFVGKEAVAYSQLFAATGKGVTPLQACFAPASRNLTRLIAPAGTAP